MYCVSCDLITAEVTLRFTPSSDQVGDHVICLMVTDSIRSSPPFCYLVSVGEETIMVSALLEYLCDPLGPERILCIY